MAVLITVLLFSVAAAIQRFELTVNHGVRDSNQPFSSLRGGGDSLRMGSVQPIVQERFTAVGDVGLGSRMGELGKSLAGLRERHEAAVESLRTKFEANLTALERENRVSDKEISHLAVEIRDLEAAIKQQRLLAKRLQLDNNRIGHDILNAKTNISTVADFTASVLNITHESLMDTPELAILAELTQEDSAHREANERVERLAEVRAAVEKAVLLQVESPEKPKMGKGRILLQLDTPEKPKMGKGKLKCPFCYNSTAPQIAVANTTVLVQKDIKRSKPKKASKKVEGGIKTNEAPKDTQDILKGLFSNLDGLAAEQNASEAEFTATFEKEYEVLLGRHQRLLAQWDEFNTTKAKDLEISRRVEMAVQHLNKTNQDLQATRRSFLAFIRRIASQDDKAVAAESH